MKKLLMTVMCLGVLAMFFAATAQARPQYKKAIDGLSASTDAEKAVQAKVKADKCNSCHVPEEKKTKRNEYGVKLSKHLPKFDKDKWKNDVDGATADLVKAINAVK